MLCFFTQEAFVEVFGNRAGANQQLARQGRHYGGENRAQDDTGNPRVEEQGSQSDEDTFVVAVHFINVGRVGAEVSDTEVADSHGTGHTQNHPGHTDTACRNQRFSAFSSHETGQNVWLAEIAQAPSGGRDNADESSTGKQAAVFFTGRSGNLLDGSVHLISTAQTQVHHDRSQYQCKNHQRSLQGIGPAYCQETAQESVGDGRAGTQPHGLSVRHTVEQALEQGSTGYDA